MHLRDLIPDKESLVTRSYWQRYNMTGSAPLPEAPEKKPVPFTLEKELAPINWAYAVIERRDPRDLSTQLLPFSPGKLILESEPAENVELSAGDIVTIFSQVDVHIPQAQRVRVVRLDGEIRSAGTYTVKPGENLEQLIARAGGLTDQAYLYGAEFLRESTRLDQQLRLDRLVQDWDRDLQQQTMQRTARYVAPEDAERLRAETEQARQLIDRLRTVKATGRVVLGLEPNQGDLKELMDIPLEDGDVFVVPARPATVNVLGAVYNQNAFLHREKLRVADYLKAAGGATRTADKDKAYIYRADGSVVPHQGFGPFRQKLEDAYLNPGDSLVVPERYPNSSFVSGLRDWTQVFSQVALGTAIVKVLK